MQAVNKKTHYNRGENLPGFAQLVFVPSKQFAVLV
jgi:hypothetical protein